MVNDVPARHLHYILSLWTLKHLSSVTELQASANFKSLTFSLSVLWAILRAYMCRPPTDMFISVQPTYQTYPCIIQLLSPKQNARYFYELNYLLMWYRNQINLVHINGLHKKKKKITVIASVNFLIAFWQLMIESLYHINQSKFL